MSATTPHGLPQLGVGATAWREAYNDAFVLLDAGLFKSGSYAARPSLVGETTPGQWFYASDVRALFYDAGSSWRLVHSASKRTLSSSASSAEELLDSDHVVEIDPTAESLDLNASTGSTHQGQRLVVRRVAGGGNVAKVSASIGGSTTELELFSNGDFVVLLGLGTGWLFLHDGRAMSEDERWTGRVTEADVRIYSRLVDLGALPNATTKSVAHSITGLADVVELRGWAKDSSDNQIPLPHADPADSIGLSATATHVVVDAGSTDRSDFDGWALIAYTKS